MEKKYLNNLYKNIQKYNIKLNNNSYIFDKINNLIGGMPENVSDDEANANIEALSALLNTQPSSPVASVDPRDQLIEEITTTMEEFLTNFEQYKQKFKTVNPEDLVKLTEIKNSFEYIQKKINQLAS
jgi:hypothetical protein